MKKKLASMDEWIENENIDSTAQIEVPKLLLDQVIGQDHAVEVIR